MPTKYSNKSPFIFSCTLPSALENVLPTCSNIKPAQCKFGDLHLQTLALSYFNSNPILYTKHTFILQLLQVQTLLPLAPKAPRRVVSCLCTAGRVITATERYFLRVKQCQNFLHKTRALSELQYLSPLIHTPNLDHLGSKITIYSPVL